VNHEDLGRLVQGGVETAKITLAAAVAGAAMYAPQSLDRPPVVATPASAAWAPAHDMPDRDPIVHLATTSVVAAGSNVDVRAQAGRAVLALTGTAAACTSRA
jgi:hypothetical protein